MHDLGFVQECYDRNKSICLFEIDTQVLLVEPVLQLAGWDIGDPKVVKRAGRSPLKHEFDIETYLNPDAEKVLRLAIECKSLRSVEFNIRKISSRMGIGKLTQKQRNNLSLYWKNPDVWIKNPETITKELQNLIGKPK